MVYRRGSLEGLWIFERATHADERGFFHEAFRAAELVATRRVPHDVKQEVRRDQHRRQRHVKRRRV